MRELSFLQPLKASDIGIRRITSRSKKLPLHSSPLVYEKASPYPAPSSSTPTPTSTTSFVPLQPTSITLPLPTATGPPPPLRLDHELQGLSPLDAQKRLTAAVRSARTPQDFATIVTAGGRLVDAICLVAILSALPRAVQRAALPAAATTLSGSAVAAATASAAATATISTNSSTSISSGAPGVPSPLSSMSSPAAAAVMVGATSSSQTSGAMGTQRTGTVLPAASQNQQQHQQAQHQAHQGSDLSDADVGLLRSLVPGLVDLVQLRLREFDANGLVTVAVGLAKLSLHVPVEAPVFRSLLSALEPRLAGLGTKALANLMWALATAGVQPCGSWLSALYGAVERQLEGFSGSDLANLMWGLAKFDLMPEAWLTDQLASACLSSLQRSHSVSDGATALTCLARYYCSYNYRLPDEVLGGFLAALQPGLRAGAPGDLVAVVHSAVCMSHLPSRSFMLELYAVLKDRLTVEPTLSHADLSRLLWSLSRVDCTPPRSWLREFEEVATPKLPHLRPRALSELIWALACWGAAPSHRFLEEFYRASERRARDYPPAQIADTLSALAKLGCRAPTPYLAALLSAFCGALPAAHAHELVAVLEGAVAVAADRRWLAAPPQRATLQLIADTAASKFAVFDACSHARLVLALARANCCPGAAWLREQQASLASAWSSEGAGGPDGVLPAGIDTATAAGLRRAYSEWDVELEPGLAAELEARGALP